MSIFLRPALSIPSAFSCAVLCGAAWGQGQGNLDLKTIQAEFHRRDAATAPLDSDQQMRLADWAVAKGLTRDAEAVYRRVLAEHPDHQRAYDALLALTASQPFENESQARRLARESLHPRFIEYQSKRFTVFTDCGSDVASRQLALLERTHHQFMRFCNRLALRPLPLKNKLVCILCSSMADFQSHGKIHDNVTDVRISGYYSPQHDWIVFYHARSSHEMARAQQDLRELRTETDDMASQASQAALNGRHDDAQAIRTAVRRSRQQIEEHRQHLDEYADHRNIATTVHEAIHQLLFHTGVQSRTTRYPLWICEGLATSFETDTPKEAFGPDREYAPRRKQFEQLLASNALLPLQDLVAIETIPDEESDTMYQQSYALVSWLCRHRKTQFREYLMRIARAPEAEPAHVQDFQASFGNVQSLERTWLNYERTAAAKRTVSSAVRK